jgi:hypothetical protein
MAGLPASPAFANAAANAVAELNTPAVAAAAITPVTVCTEASRKRKLEQAVLEGLTAGGVALVSPAEAGLADIRHATAIALAAGPAVAPPWFAGALAAQLAISLGPIQGQIENISISRSNEKARCVNSSTYRMLNFCMFVVLKRIWLIQLVFYCFFFELRHSATLE